MKVGDLVRMKTHDTGHVGIVVERHARWKATLLYGDSAQIGIKWFDGSGKTDWEPEAWLEIVSESR